MSTVSATVQAIHADGVPEPQRGSIADATAMPPYRVTRAVYLVGGGTAVLALIGLIGATQSEQQFAFSYLTAYVFAVSIAIGALFWIFLHHLTSANWSVVVRRLFENLTLCLPVLVLLFVPIALSLNALYGWMDAVANANDPLWQEKRAFLNGPWFFARALVFLVCWTGLAWRMRSLSVRQDQSGNRALTGQLVFTAAWGIVVLALTSTFAAFDWLMSLDYRWYSTMYAVYFWAGSIVGSLAALSLTVVVLHAAGWLRHTITEEHLHDLGKLLFAFVIFWAYIAFSQYLLIWYANLSDEIPWFVRRLQGSWRWATIALLVGHFVVPFVVLLSRRAKRSWVVVGGVAVWILAFHYLDLYWQVMPTLDADQAQPHWLDMVWLLVFVGIVVLGMLYGLRTSALVPIRDPRLAESLRFHQE
jgi:hypothetical protein